MIEANKAAWSELAHKVQIVADEPDLQEDYSITAADVERAAAYVREAERTGWLLPSVLPAHVLEMLAGECADAAVIKRDNAAGYLSSSAERKQLNAFARQLETLAAALAGAK
jgi:hypothetical protein